MASFSKNLWQAFGRLTHRDRGGATTQKDARVHGLSAAPAQRTRIATPDRVGAHLDHRKVVGDDRGPLSKH